MKKLLSLYILCLVALCVSAQDIIVTTAGETIAAKILEVSKTEIRYKEANYTEGPTFVLPIADIKSIAYANGKVVVFRTNDDVSINESPQPSKENVLYLLSGKTIHFSQLLRAESKGVSYLKDGSEWFVSANEIDKLVFKNGQVRTYNTTESSIFVDDYSQTNSMKILYRYGDEYMYGDTYISKNEVGRILQKYDYEAYNQWRGAGALQVAGGVFIGIGGGLALGGLIPLFTGNYMLCLGLSCSALLPLGLGLGFVLGGSAKYNKAIDIYNSRFDDASVRLNFFTTPSEVGIALSF